MKYRIVKSCDLDNLRYVEHSFLFRWIMLHQFHWKMNDIQNRILDRAIDGILADLNKAV